MPTPLFCAIKESEIIYHSHDIESKIFLVSINGLVSVFPEKAQRHKINIISLFKAVCKIKEGINMRCEYCNNKSNDKYEREFIVKLTEKEINFIADAIAFYRYSSVYNQSGGDIKD